MDALKATFVSVCLLVAAGSAPAASEIDPADPYRGATGEDAPFTRDEASDIPWIENETEVLAPPAPDNLVAVRLDSLPPGFRLYVDRSRIDVDPRDRVVRLWLWMRTSAGSESGTFEGFRCESQEYKVYAYANPTREPVVRKAPRAVWRTVSRKGSGQYRTELMRDHFCSIGSVNPTAKQIRNSLYSDVQRDPLLFSD